VNQRAVGQAKDDGFRIVGGQEFPAPGGDRDPGFGCGSLLDEDALELPATVAALLDADRHLGAEMGELADLDRGAERAGAQLEPQAFVEIARLGLHETDDRQVHQRQRDRIHIRDAQQLRIAHADAAHHVELRAGGQSAERQKNAE
jgi:hypothetical protein